VRARARLRGGFSLARSWPFEQPPSARSGRLRSAWPCPYPDPDDPGALQLLLSPPRSYRCGRPPPLGFLCSTDPCSIAVLRTRPGVPDKSFTGHILCRPSSRFWPRPTGLVTPPYGVQGRSWALVTGMGTSVTWPLAPALTLTYLFALSAPWAVQPLCMAILPTCARCARDCGLLRAPRSSFLRPPILFALPMRNPLAPTSTNVMGTANVRAGDALSTERARADRGS